MMSTLQQQLMGERRAVCEQCPRFRERDYQWFCGEPVDEHGHYSPLAADMWLNFAWKKPQAHCPLRLWRGDPVPETVEQVAAAEAQFGESRVELPEQLKAPPTGPGRFLRGAAKLGRALLTKDSDESARRLEICGECDQFTGIRCKLCGCFARFKARLARERCPLGKWERGRVALPVIGGE